MQNQGSGNPRDFYLNRRDIRNIDVKLQGDKWRLHESLRERSPVSTADGGHGDLVRGTIRAPQGVAEQLQQAAQVTLALELLAEGIMERSSAGN